MPPLVLSQILAAKTAKNLAFQPKVQLVKTKCAQNHCFRALLILGDIKTIPPSIKGINHQKGHKTNRRGNYPIVARLCVFSLSVRRSCHQDLKQCELAGAEGLEPTAYGFGDRRSTN
jgi:hypothetical protein